MPRATACAAADPTALRPRAFAAENAAHIDNPLRRFLHNPRRMLGRYVSEGATVVDIGCGTGLFAVAMAEMTGPAGRVIALDVQQEMLDLTRAAAERRGVLSRMEFHRCTEDTLGLHCRANLVLAFWMAHEVPSLAAFFSEVRDVLAPGGRLLLVEPMFHVGRSAFKAELAIARHAGLRATRAPLVALSRSALLMA
jgi:ubiquinone/menaquinone biosynthesis C-methylase UbiE